MYLDSLLEDIFSTHNNFYDVTKENFPQDYKMDDFYEELRFINERNASEQRLHQAIVEGNAAKAKHELRLTNKRSNIVMDIFVLFPFPHCVSLKILPFQ